MPIISDANDKSDQINPDDVPRPVVVYGAKMAGTRFELEHHFHTKAQLIMTLNGLLKCEIEGGLWMVPPHCAIWIPSGVLHTIQASGDIEGYNAFIDTNCTGALPTTCCTVSIPPLLRELLLRAAEFPALYPTGGAESRITRLILDEIACAPIEPLHLPIPNDPRLRKIVDAIQYNPSDRRSLDSWASHCHVSKRTLSRILARETGMSFGRWRQQLTITHALQMMAKDMSVQQIATELGYESTSGFVTMFRKIQGVPPGRYMNTIKMHNYSRETDFNQSE